jgi:hypothetical protein
MACRCPAITAAVLVLVTALSVSPLHAQNSSRKGKEGERKSLIFAPGSKVPEPTPTPAEAASDKKAEPDASPSPAAEPSPAESPATSSSEGPFSAAAASTVDPVVSKLLTTFFALLSRGHVDPAYEALVQDTVIAAKKEDVNTLKQRTNQAIQLFGAIKGSEVVDIQHVGTRLVRITCISLGERFPLRWRFYFYNNGEKWRLIDISVDDRLTALFSEPLDAD